MSDKPVMTKRQEELFRLFKVAIESERSAQKLYQNAMALCDDEKLKAIIAGFYRQEVEHERALLESYKKYRELFATPDQEKD